ncbi:MAG TPA: TlpA disulfide reductase family protein [Acetobacteraceae bacterium]|nr:TlpA disulfide reductase family protein [Acetobacteraceae bacterium]
MTGSVPFPLRLGRRSAIAGLGAACTLAVARRARASDLDTLSDALEQVNPPTIPPSFSFQTATGARQTLADYRGRGLVLNIWATWCGPCVAEMPALDALAARVAPFDILVLPVSIDSQGLAAVKPFYGTHGIAHLPILLDPDGDVAHAFKVQGIPTSFLVDRFGRVVGTVEGPVQWDSAGAIATIRGLIGPGLSVQTQSG